MRRRTVIGSAGATLPAMLAGCVSDDFIEPIDDEEDTTDSDDENGFDESGDEDGNEDSETTDESDEGEAEDSDAEQSNDENEDEEAGDEPEPGDDDDESGEEDEEADAEGEEETDESDEELDEEMDAEGEEETDESEEELDEDEEVDDNEDEDDDEAYIEEPPTSEITIQVTDVSGEPIANAEIQGEGEPHEADIPLEFDGETNANGIHSTPIYENEYMIEVSHPDYVTEMVEHVHDGETEVTVELEAEDDGESDSFDEMDGQVHYSGDYQDMYEVTEHSIEQQNPSRDEPPLCLISLTIENTTEDHEVMVYYGGVAIDENGSSVGSGTDSATSLGPGDASQATLEAYDCSGAADYRISLEATNANEVPNEN